MGNAVTESYFAATLDRSEEIPDEVAGAIRATRQRQTNNGAVVETYRGTGLEAALSLLVPAVR